jgi:copper chaperone CopZ
VIGFAWFQKLKPRKEINCDCETDENSSFWQSKKFLGIITIFAALMLSFPHYSGMFFPDSESKTIIIKESSLSEVILTIEGMTCTGCEHSVNHALSSLEGVLESRVSFESGKAIVQFDKTKLNPDQLSHTIEKETGYKVINIETQE